MVGCSAVTPTVYHSSPDWKSLWTPSRRPYEAAGAKVKLRPGDSDVATDGNGLNLCWWRLPARTGGVNWHLSERQASVDKGKEVSAQARGAAERGPGGERAVTSILFFRAGPVPAVSTVGGVVRGGFHWRRDLDGNKILDCPALARVFQLCCPGAGHVKWNLAD